ncbi:MAG: hypothetical protein LLF94_05980, partial [Chlamydiales bacterium]|nr:hypothetical protein [Chlamydiales bacterium]
MTIGGNKEFSMDNLKMAYEFCQSFEQNKAAVGTGPNTKFTNLFLVHVGNKLEFVQKYSFRGVYMRVISFFKGKSDATFNINENLKLANKIFQDTISKLPLDDINQLDAIATKLGITTNQPHPGQVLKDSVTELKTYLQQLQGRVEASRLKMDRSLPKDKNAVSIPLERNTHKFPLYAKPVSSVYAAYGPQYRAAHAAVYAAVQTATQSVGLNNDELNAVVDCIISSGNETAIVDNLKNNILDSMLFAVRRTLNTVLPKESLEVIRQVLAKLAPLNKPSDAVSALFVAEKFPAFLGSSFSRGSDKMEFGSIKTALTDYLAANPNQDLAKLVSTSIDLSQVNSAVTLQASLQEVLATNNRCLLLGGYEGQPMVFVVEPQDNGAYTLKIFTQEPALNHQELKSSADKNKGYLEIPNIPESLLFKQSGVGASIKNAFAYAGIGKGAKPTLLEAFVALRSPIIENPEVYFAENVLKQCPQPVDGDGFNHHLLRPEMPGTSASRAFVAALSSTIKDQTEARGMRTQFDVHLLERFEHDLSALAGKNIAVEDYTRIRALANNIKFAFTECKERLKGFDGALHTLALHADLADRLEQKLTECQKRMYSMDLATKITVADKPLSLIPKAWKPAPTVDTIDTTNTKTKRSAPEPMGKQEQVTLNAIKNLSASQALEQLAKLDQTSEFYLYITGCFFKKFGSIKALRDSNFTKPQDALQQVKVMVNALASKCNAETQEGSSAELFGSFLAATYMLEGILQKLDPKKTAIPQNFSSVLASGAIYKQVESVRTSDPFWAASFREILQIREHLVESEIALTEQFEQAKRDGNIKLIANLQENLKQVQNILSGPFTASLESKEMQLTKDFADKIQVWIRGKGKDFPAAEAIRTSITADRKKQEALITAEVTQEIKNVGICEKEKTRLLNELEPLQNKLEDVKTRGKKHEAQIIKLGGTIAQQLLVKAREGLSKGAQKLVGTTRTETRAKKQETEALEKQKAEEIKALNKSLSTDKAEITRLEGEIAILQKQVDLQDDMIAHSMLGINGGKVVSYKKEKASFQSQVETLRTQLENEIEKVEELAQQIAEGTKQKIAKRGIDALYKSLTTGNEEITRLKGEIDALKKTQIELQNKANAENAKLMNDPLSWQLGGISRNVRTNPDFWPWGVGETDTTPAQWGDAWAPWEKKDKVVGNPTPTVDAPWDSKQVAAFFVANQLDFFKKKLNGVSDPLPAEFRTFLDANILGRNIFYKTDGEMPGSIPIQIDANLNLTIGDIGNARFDEKGARPDFYFEELSSNDLKTVYTHVYSVPYKDDPDQKDASHLLELNIPNIVGQGITKALPRDYKAPTIRERAGNVALAVGSGIGAAFEAVRQKGVGGAARAAWQGLKRMGRRNVALKDELRDLCQLHSAKGMQIDSTISYFQENPKKLFSQDSRLLLHALLFESDFLLTAFQNERTQSLVANRLRSLFTDVIGSAARMKDEKDNAKEAIDTYANIIWIAANVQNHLNRFPLAEKTPSILSAEDIFTFTKTFAEHKYEEYCPVVFESAVAASGLLFDGKTDTAEGEKLFACGLLARVLQRKYPLAENSTPCAARNSDALQAEHKFKEHLVTIDRKKLTDLVNTFAPEVLGKMVSILAKASFVEGENSSFITSDGLTTLSLVDATIDSDDPNYTRQYTNSVPTRVVDILTTQKLFKNAAACTLLRCYTEGSVCCIEDNEHNLYIKVKGNDVFIQRKGQGVDEPWCYHQNPKLELKNQEQLEKYHQWADPTNQKIYLVDKGTLKAVYETNTKGNITKTFETTTNDNKKTYVTRELGQPSQESLFNDFEHVGSTFYWMDDKKEIQEIDFPRLGMTLEKRSDGKLGPKGMNDWNLAQEQIVPGLDQRGGFLVLENKNTHEKKGIFPLWDLKNDGTYNFNPNDEVGRTVEVAITKDALVPKTVEARYF